MLSLVKGPTLFHKVNFSTIYNFLYKTNKFIVLTDKHFGPIWTIEDLVIKTKIEVRRKELKHVCVCTCIQII